MEFKVTFLKVMKIQVNFSEAMLKQCLRHHQLMYTGNFNGIKYFFV